MSGHGFRKIEGIRFATGAPFLAATWIPEGIVLTPRTASAPYGYGFPKRDRFSGAKINPPFGTLIENEEDSALNQVLINRFENNKYLDKVAFLSGVSEEVLGKLKLTEINDRLRDSLFVELIGKPYTIIYWPLFYEPTDSFWSLTENRINWTDVPGVNRWSGGYNFVTAPKPTLDENGTLVGSLPNRQIDDDRQSLIYETESETWYCHWPEELLYDNDAAEAIFQETNRYRSVVGREPLVREIRGYANTGRMILSEMQRAKVQYHDNEELYRIGYGTVEYRLLNGGVNPLNGGENLITGSVLSGFSWDTGIAVALGWRNSPLHYSNMISTSWNAPKHSTSLDVFGNVSVTLTEKGSQSASPSILDETFDPPLSGKSWSQLFVRRSRWLYAGNCEHRTQYGTVTTGSFLSPVGIPYFLAGASYYLYYQGRVIFIKHIYDIEQALEVTCVNLGACLCLKNNVLSYRVIFFYLNEATVILSSCSRPVSGEHLEWEEEHSLSLPENNIVLFYECCSFSSDGTIGFVTCMEYLTDRTFSWYFNEDMPSGAVNVCPAGKRIINFVNGVFSIGELIVGPEINHTMTVYNEEDNKYNYTQEGSGTVNIAPFIDASGGLSAMQYEMNHFVEQKWSDDENYETVFNINDTLIFKSGKRLQIKKINFSGEGDTNLNDGLFELEEDAYFLSFFYFNPVTEDVVYAKHNIEFNNGVSVQTDIYVNDDLIKSYPLFALTTVAHIRVRPVIKRTESRGDYGDGILCTFNFRNFDALISGSALAIPLWFGSAAQSGFYDGYFCVDRPNELAMIGRIRVGSYPATIQPSYAFRRFCYNNQIGGQRYIESGYSIGIPYANLQANEGLCYFARYKDRFVTQLFISNLWGINSTTVSADDRNIIHANFLIDNEIGIGDLESLIPFGVIYA